MKLVATIKVKATRCGPLLDMSEVFLKAVQYAIDKGFEAKISNKFKLHHLVYKSLRQWLPADFAIEAIAKASENLKSTKLEKKPIMKSCPISFNRNLFTFSSDKVRLATFTKGKRQDFPINIPEYYWKYLDWRYQTLEVIKDKKGRMFFHVTFSREVDSPTSCGNEIVGKFFTGYKTKIIQFQYLRRKLQRKGTKSAKRLLRKLSGRQKRYMRWINHKVSKEVVASADTIVLEDLKGIRKIKRGKRFNRWLHSWSFFQLQSFIKYKAVMQGKAVVFVSPYLTSQTCSSCNKLGSRYYDSFFCAHCGFSSQSDFNASCNLRRLHVNQPNVSDREGRASFDGLRLNLGTSPTSI